MRPLYQLSTFLNYRANRVAFERRCIYPTSPKWVEALGYILGWCLRKHVLELYAFCYFFNHGHYDLGHPFEDAPDVEPRFSAFFEDLHWWNQRLLQKAGGWEHGPAYTRLERTYQGPSLDADQVWHDLCYDTAQAVAAGFFRRSRQYPGLCFQPEDVLQPRIFRRNELIEKLDPERQYFLDDEIEVRLSIPRPFRHMTPEEYVQEFRTRLDQYEASAAPPRVHAPHQARKICNATRLGQRLTPEDLHRKTRAKRAPKRPPGHAPVNSTDPNLKREFYAQRRDFWSRHQRAFLELRAGRRDVRFPLGTYGWRRRLNVAISAEPVSNPPENRPRGPD